MKDFIDQIRNLLIKIEEESTSDKVDSFEHNFDTLELPNLICQIVDYLQAKLYSYEAAIYYV